jgi:hypothetical protein
MSVPQVRVVLLGHSLESAEQFVAALAFFGPALVVLASLNVRDLLSYSVFETLPFGPGRRLRLRLWSAADNHRSRVGNLLHHAPLQARRERTTVPL